MDLGKRVYALRKKKGLSQVELAEKLNCSRQAVSRWETGAVIPTIENLDALRIILDVSWNELLGEEPANREEPVPIPGPVQPNEGWSAPCPWNRSRGRAVILICALLLAVSLVCLWFAAPWQRTENEGEIWLEDMEVREKEEQTENNIEFDLTWDE